MRMFYPEKRVIFEQTFYVPARKFPEFAKGEIDAFVSSFKEFDLDGSGSISASELEEAFKRMGQGSSKQQVQDIIDRVDVDGSGEIEWPEFLEVISEVWMGIDIVRSWEDSILKRESTLRENSTDLQE